MTIAIVTDSTADLPKDILEEHHIYVIPAMLNIDGKSYADGEGISREEFYQNLPAYKTPPTTSAPSIGIFHQMYEKLLSEGATLVISIHVNSAFSSLFNIAYTAAQAFRGCVKVIDSQQVTLGLGFQAIAAAQAAARGAAFEEIQRLVASVNERVHFLALLDTIEYLGRSGRIGWVTAMVGNFLNLKLLIQVRMGQVYRLGLYRNRKQGLDQLLYHLRKVSAIKQIAFAYTSLADPDDLNKLLEIVVPEKRLTAIVTPVTTVIGTHVGPNGIGFIAVSE